jgi:hypothetical protein
VANEKSVGEVLRELRDLLVAYARQETVEPLNRLKHYLGFGIPGALVMSLGLLLVSLGILRGFQHISWTSTGFGSLLPYAAMVVFQGIVIFVCYRKIRSSMAGRGVGASAAETPSRNLDGVEEVSRAS